MREAMAICSRKAGCDRKGCPCEKIRWLLNNTVKSNCIYIYLLEKKKSIREEKVEECCKEP